MSVYLDLSHSRSKFSESVFNRLEWSSLTLLARALSSEAVNVPLGKSAFVAALNSELAKSGKWCPEAWRKGLVRLTGSDAASVTDLIVAELQAPLFDPARESTLVELFSAHSHVLCISMVGPASVGSFYCLPLPPTSFFSHPPSLSYPPSLRLFTPFLLF
jgi:hypothetical protein